MEGRQRQHPRKLDAQNPRKVLQSNHGMLRLIAAPQSSLTNFCAIYMVFSWPTQETQDTCDGHAMA